MELLYKLNVDTSLKFYDFGVIVEMSSDTFFLFVFFPGEMKYEKQKSLSYAPFNLTGVAEKLGRY